jgi:enoyl-CoA hydratase/carnithine racemase
MAQNPGQQDPYSAYRFMTVVIVERVATVTLNHPPANVLSAALLGELEQLLARLERDAAVRVVILTGKGRFFCTGADIRELALVNTAREGLELSLRGQALFNRVEQFEKPVIAAINGTCLGGGLELAMACHLRIAATGTDFGLPEVQLGLIPGYGGTQRLPRIIGVSKAAELILTGATITAEEALSYKLVTRVVPALDLIKEARAVARTIASKSRPAIQSALQAFRAALDRPMSEGLTREAELFGELCESPDKKEGVSAFLEKRPPRFTDL